MNAAGAAAGDHLELAEEQAHLDRAYVSLQRMRHHAQYLKDLGYLGGNVTEGGVETHDRQQWERDKQQRIDLLTDRPGALCFGRIDQYSSQRWYIGRRHIEDEDGEPLVADWRAAVAIPFYRATVADPMGLDLRRRFLVESRHIVDIFDENLADPGAVEAGAYVPDPLLAEVGRGRTGSMRDIVATIQAEQDVIIRAPLESCIVVQGGRYRQDRGRPAPCRLPPLRTPVFFRARTVAHCRAQPHLPPLYFASVAVPRGGRLRPVDDRRPGRGQVPVVWP